MSENFAKLEQWNPLLASEIRKLPEFQDGIAIQEEKALYALVELYADNPKIFSNAFEQMYQVGIPEIRKYCSPLQALFWLIEDGKEKEINELLKPYTRKLNAYTIDRLLKKAWIFDKSAEIEPTKKVLQLTQDEAQSIISELSKDKQDFYKDMSHETINDTLFRQYKGIPGYFPKEIRKTIKSYLKQIPNENYKNYVRWKDFNTVLDRLNSPELVDYWIWNNIKYKRGYVNTPWEVFKKKEGHCISTGYFGNGALKRAGYTTFMRHVSWGHWGTKDHCGSGVILDDGKYLLVVDFDGSSTNTTSGPYKDISQVDDKLARGRKIIERMNGSYFMPGQ
jgi:hypothetical protein